MAAVLADRTRLFAALVLCAALAVFGYTLARASVFGPTEEELSPAQLGASARTTPDEYPLRLKIPVLGVDAAVQDVGVAKSGRMAVPTNYADVGWYRYGPAAGEQGNAVFDGHVDNGFGRLGVFARLHMLRKGDEVSVVYKDGREARFVVEEVAAYQTAEVPLEEIFSESGPPKAVLITCEGTFDPESKTYDRRLVVYARLAS